jgi:FkbM family methyltransferase
MIYLKKAMLYLMERFIELLPSSIESIFLNVIEDKFERKNSMLSRSAKGKYGLIQGSARDNAILETYAKSGVWAERTNDLLENFFSRNDYKGTYLDIGANIGLTTIPISKHSGITCHSFEPEPKNFNYLNINMQLNCLHENVSCYNFGLSDNNEILPMELSYRNLGDHRIRKNEQLSRSGENLRKSVNINLKKLDSIGLDSPNPLAVKIDTQGAEPFVISGGIEILKKSDLVILEYTPYMMNRMGSNPEEIWSFIFHFNKIRILIGEQAIDSLNKIYSPEEAKPLLEKFFDEHKFRTGCANCYCDIILEH